MLQYLKSDGFFGFFRGFNSNNIDEFATSIRLKTTEEIKTLLEEVIPISKFAKKYFLDNSKVLIKPIVGNQSYDALIEGCDDISYLEVTRAIDGYGEKLRNEYLDAYGSVWAMGRIDVKGTKASGDRKVEFCKEAVSRKDTMGEIKELIKKRILNKIGRQANYSEKTFLIVTFEDVFWDKLGVEDTNAIDNLIDEEIVKLEHSFCGICILGEHNSYFRII